MKATKLTIGFREWSKLPDFVEMINEEDEMVAYEIDNTTALIVLNFINIDSIVFLYLRLITFE